MSGLEIKGVRLYAKTIEETSIDRIVPILDIIDTTDIIYYAMPLCESVDGLSHDSEDYKSLTFWQPCRKEKMSKEDIVTWQSFQNAINRATRGNPKDRFIRIEDFLEKLIDIANGDVVKKELLDISRESLSRALKKTTKKVNLPKVLKGKTIKKRCSNRAPFFDFFKTLLFVLLLSLF